MTKSDLIRSIYDEFEVPRRQVTEIVEHVFVQIESSLISGDVVRLPLGVFRIRDRAARVARNPATGEPVKVPAKRVLKFLPSKAIKEAVALKPRQQEEIASEENDRKEDGGQKDGDKKDGRAVTVSVISGRHFTARETLTAVI
jgi:nucleoid DNA-binding protein